MRRFLILLALLPLKALACSAFFCNGEMMIFAKNFDWGDGQGYVIKNVSGQKKVAYGFRGSNQAEWTSKFGSITFNQIGKEFPYGGMNTKGLVVEQLWMSESIYPNNGNSTISELEWIQYQLDNYSEVDEILHNLNNLTIKPVAATIHYFIADRNGNSAVIDFVDGKAVVNRKQGKYQVITNETFLDSEEYYVKHGSTTDTASRAHYDRYCQIKNSLSNSEVESPYKAFEILRNSSENRPGYKTYWTVVYDLKELKIYFRSYNNTIVKQIDLSGMNFSSGSDVEASNINQDHFKPESYTIRMNTALLSASLKGMGLKMDEQLASAHQMVPDQHKVDGVYQHNHMDLTVTFLSRSAKGNIYYAIMNGEENFKKRKAIKSGVFRVQKHESRKVFYALPRVEFALACFQDTDLNNKIDKKIFGIPKNYGFSRNKRGLFGTPPKYSDAKIELNTGSEIVVKIK